MKTVYRLEIRAVDPIEGTYKTEEPMVLIHIGWWAVQNLLLRLGEIMVVSNGQDLGYTETPGDEEEAE